MIIKLNQNEILLIKQIATEWFAKEKISSEWERNWEAAVKIYYRSESWNENQIIDIEEFLLDDFKDCIQDYVFQGYEKKIGLEKFTIAKALFINILKLLEIKYPPGLYIPLEYEDRSNREKVFVNPLNDPIVELSKKHWILKSYERLRKRN